MPVYYIKTPSGEHLIDATNKHTAINHVVRDTITAESITASDLVLLMQKGLTVETAGESEKGSISTALNEPQETAGEMDLSGPETDESEVQDAAA